jgi:hypothetical protein
MLTLTALTAYHFRDLAAAATHEASGLSRVQYDRVLAFARAAPRFLLPLGGQGCCVAAARLACDVLGDCYHMRVRPLVVEAHVFNPVITAKLTAKGRAPSSAEECQQWGAEGGWSESGWWITIGCRQDRDVVSGGWPGHLVAVVNETCLLDLALVQASRPHKGIRLAPLVAGVNAAFLAGNEGAVAVWVVNGCQVEYQAYPHDTSYRAFPAWQTLSGRRRETVRLVRRQMDGVK